MMTNKQSHDLIIVSGELIGLIF